VAKLALVVVISMLAGAAGAAFYLSLAGPTGSVRSERAYDDRDLRAEIEQLREDLQRAVRDLSRESGTEAVRGAGSGGTVAADDAPDENGAERTGTEAAPAVREFEPTKYVASLKGKKFSSQMRDRLITSLSVQPEKIDATIESLLAAVKDDPNNAELQTALASAYTAKTAFGTAQGPAQGIPFMKALGAYNKALELDPDHWTASFGKAFDTSMAPEFIGMRPTAIREFEGLMERQEARAPQPEFERTYIRLGTLYKDAGNTEKARSIWKRGIQQFPESRQLREALSVIETK